MARPNAWYGWRPDKPDFRDLYAVEKPRTVPLPDVVDLRPLFQPVYDQGQLGSCTANAIAGVIQFGQRKQKLAEFIPSRLFIYYNERVIEGTISEDAGAEIRDGVKSVNKLGAPPEKDWKYIESKFAHKPTKKAYTDGKKHPSLRYSRVRRSTDAMRGCLADGFPFVFGFTCYDSFEGSEVAKTGILNMPASDENVVGGHAVICVGYDIVSKRVIVRNSWAADWGQNGYFTMPFDYILDENLADDFWVIKQVQ
jgi:C1A family cysteine protease